MSDALDALQRVVTRRATKAQIIAESGGSLEEQRYAYATDTGEWGICTNGTWTWFAGSASVPAFATPAIVLGTVAAAGAAATVIRSDATIVAFDATVPVTQAFGDAAATGSAAKAARRDHKHAMPGDPTATAASIQGLGFVGPLLIADSPSTPLVFGDLLQNEDQDDLIYQDL